MKNLLSITALVISLSTVGYLIYSNSSHRKEGFIMNKTLFENFKGKKFLEEKLNKVKDRNKHKLDSIESILELDPKNAYTLNSYQETARACQLEEQQLSDQYTAEIWKQINSYLIEFGKENNYDFILGAKGDGNLMYANDQSHVTEDALIYINSRYDGVK